MAKARLSGSYLPKALVLSLCLQGIIAVRLRGMAPGAAAAKGGGGSSSSGSGSEPPKFQNPYFTLQPIMPTEVGQLGGIGIHQCDGALVFAVSLCQSS
jgi:hypothetical protein